MKQVVYLALIMVILLGLTGCPLGVSNRKLEGAWQWVEPSRLVDPRTVDDHDSVQVAQHFANEGRLRKTLVFGKENAFIYTEEVFLPDRQAALRGDKGVGVAWDWVQTYIATGVFDTSRFAEANRELAIPGLDTELNVQVSEYTDTYVINRRDTDGNLVRDSQLRILVDYVTATGVADADNPLALRGRIGLTPFDELMVAWARFTVGKDLDYNRSHDVNVETYLRVDGD